MIALSDISMRFGAQELFAGVTWRLQDGAHYGLVGANGTGKSTLLRLLTGELRPEGGTLARPNDLALGTLGQDQFAYDGLTPLDVVIGGKPRLQAALTEKAALLHHLDGRSGSEADGNRLAELETQIADAGGYEAEARAATLLTGLGLGQARHTQPMRQLSGGYRLRVLLGRTLFSEPELLLLDEPTNHLDIDSIRWLESYLRAFAGTFVVVSHDRHFLNAVCDHIADVDYQELRLYPGDYDAFEAAKALAVEQKEAEITRAEEKIAEMQRFIERFKAKATKARQAQSRKKQVERMEMPEIKRSSRRAPGFRFAQRRPSGREVVAAQGLGKAYGEARVLHDVSFTLERGERLAVVGPNGIGKSTLLKLLAGVLTADAGTLRLGYEAHAGYFAQDHHEVLRGKTSVYEWLHSQAPGESIGTIRGLLGRVLFSGDDADKSIGDLSGGEAARLLLAHLMLRQDNLLILDEPTNHLDLEGRAALMEALADYDGTLVFVSHDRHFVSRVGRRVLVLSSTGVEDVHGNYEDYLATRGEDFLAGGTPPGARPGARSGARGASASPAAGASGATRGGAATGGAATGAESHAERKERKRALGRLRKQVQHLEQEVARLEGELEALEARFATADYSQPAQRSAAQQDRLAHAETRRRLQATLAEWERTASELERLQEAS